LQRVFFGAIFSDWVARGIPEALSQLKYYEEMAFGVKATERSGGQTGEGEKGDLGKVEMMKF